MLKQQIDIAQSVLKEYMDKIPGSRGLRDYVPFLHQIWIRHKTLYESALSGQTTDQNPME